MFERKGGNMRDEFIDTLTKKQIKILVKSLPEYFRTHTSEGVRWKHWPERGSFPEGLVDDVLKEELDDVLEKMLDAVWEHCSRMRGQAEFYANFAREHGATIKK